MPVVRVEPLGAEIEVHTGETLMGAAERIGYRWPTACHGRGECTACFVLIEKGVDCFAAADPLELAGLNNLPGRSFYEGRTVRLACQARPVADAVVFKRGLRLRTDLGAQRASQST